MSGNQAISTETPRTSFSIGASGGMTYLGGGYGSIGKVSVDIQKGGTHAQVFGGTGQVTAFGAEVGHEWNWGDFGVDITARGQYKSLRKPASVDMEIFPETHMSADNLSEQTEVTISEKRAKIEYKPKSVGGDVTLKGTYTSEHVKLGLGVRAGYTTPSRADLNIYESVSYIDADNQMQMSIQSEKYLHLGESNDVTGFRFSPVATAEISLGKEGQHKINIAGALDEVTVGYSYTLPQKKAAAPQDDKRQYIIE